MTGVAGMFAWQYATESMARRAFVAVREKYLGRVNLPLSVWRFTDPTRSSHVLCMFMMAESEDELRMWYRRIGRCWQVDSGAPYDLSRDEVAMFLARRGQDEIDAIANGLLADGGGMVSRVTEAMNEGRGLFLHRDGMLSAFPEPRGSG